MVKSRWNVKQFGFMAVLVVIGAVFLIACSPDPGGYRQAQPSEYYLYRPSNYSTDRAWPVFVGIHGEGGNGRDCWSTWQPYADAEGFVLVCPSLSDTGAGWLQSAGESKLTQILQQVSSKNSVQGRVFIAGFSAGGQFAQGFAFDYPDSVMAVSSISAGNYYQYNQRAANIPFLIIVGDSDTTTAINQAKTFSATLGQNAFTVDLQILKGMGHEITGDSKDLTIKLFRKVFNTGK